MTLPLENPKHKTKKYFFIKSARLATSFEGWNSSQAQSAGEIYWFKVCKKWRKQ